MGEEQRPNLSDLPSGSCSGLTGVKQEVSPAPGLAGSEQVQRNLIWAKSFSKSCGWLPQSCAWHTTLLIRSFDFLYLGDCFHQGSDCQDSKRSRGCSSLAGSSRTGTEDPTQSAAIFARGTGARGKRAKCQGPEENGTHRTNEIRTPAREGKILKGESLQVSSSVFLFCCISALPFSPSVLLTRRVKIGFY